MTPVSFRGQRVALEPVVLLLLRRTWCAYTFHAEFMARHLLSRVISEDLAVSRVRIWVAVHSYFHKGLTIPAARVRHHTTVHPALLTSSVVGPRRDLPRVAGGDAALLLTSPPPEQSSSRDLARECLWSTKERPTQSLPFSRPGPLPKGPNNPGPKSFLPPPLPTPLSRPSGRGG